MNKVFLSTLIVAGVFVAIAPTPASANHSVQESEAAAAVQPAMHTATASSVALPAACEFEHNLGIGSKGGEVSCLQQELIEAGHLTAIDAPTGTFGALTAAALKEWQAEHDIAATGYFGTLTRAALHEHVHEALDMAHTGTTTEPAHTHTSLDVSGWKTVPSVTATLHTDAMGGYNLEVTPKNFTFAPEHVNGAVVAGEGHAHVYINDVKYTRLYGPWMYLPASAFKKGENTVRVTLNANDHSDLARGTAVIEASDTITVK